MNENPGESGSQESKPVVDTHELSTGHKIAVLLNENARKVTGRMKRAVSDIVPRASLYTSRTSEEAYQAVKDMIDRGYERIFSGGGDGSIIQLVNMIRRYVDEKNSAIESFSPEVPGQIERINYPRIGILKLGTGNGMSYVVGAKRGIRNIRKALAEPGSRTINLSLIEAEQKCFTFSGLGWDAAIINDFAWLKQKFTIPTLRRVIGGVGGYLGTIAFRTIPREIHRRRKPEVIIRSTGDPVYQVVPPGIPVPMHLGPGEVIYEGPVSVTGVGTVPYYGFKVKAFPYSNLSPEFMNLRVINAGVFECVSHAYPIWMGRYQSENFLDYLTTGATMEFSESMPMQIGGDACGYRDNIMYTMSDHMVEVVDLR
ncbi:diacylglycerol/lipid kinase family protein [Thermodesulfobacteriota bacterium]